MAQKMLSVKELSELMGVGIHTAERLVKADGFPSIRIGHRYFVPEREYDEWVRRKCRSGKDVALPGAGAEPPGKKR